MKKTLLVLAMAFIGSQAIGQVGAGRIFISGFGSIQTQSGQTEVTGGPTTVTTDHDKEFGGMLGVGGGYFLTDNIAAGIGIAYMGSKTTPADTSNPEVQSSGFGLTLGARYYVPVADNFYFHGGLYYGFSSQSSKMTQGGTETDGPKFTSNSIGIRPGFSWFAAPNFAFDMTFGNLGWTGSKMESTGANTTTTSKSSGMDVSFDLTTVNFGIQYFLGN